MALRTRQKKEIGSKGRVKGYRDFATHPIKDKKQRVRLLKYLQSQRDCALTDCEKRIADRNWMIVYLAMSSAYRAEDITQLRVSQCDLQDGVLEINEAKTRKLRYVSLSTDCVDELSKYITRNSLTCDDYLFPSRQSISRSRGAKVSTKCDVPCVTVRRMDQIVNAATKRVGITQKVVMHGLRKTFGYILKTEQGLDTEDIRKIYGHSSTDVTERYIDWRITDQAIKKAKGIKLD
jgi:integrase